MQTQENSVQCIWIQPVRLLIILRGVMDRWACVAYGVQNLDYCAHRVVHIVLDIGCGI